jgi:acetyl esterase/lipase
VRRAAAIAAVAVVAAVVAIVLLTRGDADAQERFVVGSGTTAAVVMRPHDAGPGRPVVLFLHGWTANVPQAYGAWLRHLVDEGADVVFPIYQRWPFDDVRTPLPNVLAAVRAALARLPGHGPLIAAGHSAGGSLSSDYAASAASAGLPRPVAVYAVYPGRDLGLGLFLRGPPLSGIAAGTRLLVLESPTDRVVGTATARSIVAGATRVHGELRTIRDPFLGEHNAPMGDTPRIRSTFWSPLDRAVRAATG